jgi:quinoprotein glucose dehydrogenase
MRYGIGNVLLGTLIVATVAVGANTFADEWPVYGRDPQSTRYSPLSQITPQNVAQLRRVWTFHTGDFSDGHSMPRSSFETTPLMIAGRLYLTTSFSRVLALDAESGRPLWTYDPHIDRSLDYGDGLVNRGLAAWSDPTHPTGVCALRLFEASLDARLIAVDAATGRPCPQFGRDGQIDLTHVANYKAGWYHMSSPPIVVDGVVVVGSSINDNSRAEMPDGVVRGYDARTGRLLWNWEPLKRPAAVPASAWHTGAANAWSILSADPEHHRVYIPTGSASPDYYGGLRPGDDRWADSVVALDSRTGKLVWGFQLVHHNLWDYDTTAAPLITSIRLHGHRAPVLVAGNKTGMLYVLDPATGAPVLPIEERPVPQSTIPGEVTSPTQPFPVSLPTLAPRSLAPSAAWGITKADRTACRHELEETGGASIFAPPTLRGTTDLPGPLGGINWSGYAWDARHQQLIVAITNLAWRVQLIPAEKVASAHREPHEDIGLQQGAPYAVARETLVAPSGVPCTPPPWGEIVAVDLAAGRIAWRHPLGTVSDLFPGVGKTIAGSPILGGPIVTASGLIFIGGSMDRRVHALSSETGKELWSAALPASAHAQPITYAIGGRQFLVIAAGADAHIDEERPGDALVAFALPRAAR